MACREAYARDRCSGRGMKRNAEDRGVEEVVKIETGGAALHPPLPVNPFYVLLA